MSAAANSPAVPLPGARALPALAPLLLAIAGCGHRSQVAQAPPQMLPPSVLQPVPGSEAPIDSGSATLPPAKIPMTPVPPGGVTAEDLQFVATHKPIASEEGLATWYTAPYAGRKAANGQVFDDSAMTAAHRTLPMGSLIVVTNLKTGQSSAMRITDRGPFVEGRILDLTIASARATGIYRAGLAQVRMDVYQTPKPIQTGGRWCVQIGALHSESAAIELKRQLLRQYSDATVIEFPGENSYWVRIRPLGDDRQRAKYIALHLTLTEGDAYLTRLD